MVPALLMAGGPISNSSVLHKLALVLFLSWPVWLWPMIKRRRRSMVAFVASLVVSGIALAWVTVPMVFVILVLSGAHFHI